MRIIAGEARGRTLVAPKGSDTRPTQDYVRESLFNILRLDVAEACVLDLFAGSGALALEAVSRGASAAAMADCSAQAVACIRRNVEASGFGERCAVYKADWKDALAKMAAEGRSFNLVFLDPPYRMTGLETVCARMAELRLLQDGAKIVIEHRRGCAPAPDEWFALRDTRRYGDTEISFFTYQEGEKNMRNGL
jgi:16S rRNA (guanine966-N2)-methyltransferase